MALNAVASNSYTTVPDRHVASAQHGVAVQPKRLRLSRTSEACCGSERPREQPGATHALQAERSTPPGVSAAHLKAFQHGASRKVFHRTARWGLHDAAQQRRRSTPHTPCNCVKVVGAGRGGCGVQGGPPLRMQVLGRASQLLSSSPPRAVRGVSTSKILLRRCAPGGSTSCFSAWPCGVAAAA